MPETLDISCILAIYLVGLMLIVWELLTPGFVVGLFGLFITVCSVVLAFHYHPDNPFLGIALLAVALLVVPLVFVWAFRRTTLKTSQNTDTGYTATTDELKCLIGKTGISVSLLRPYGLAEIEGRRLDVTTENAMIEKGTPLRVLRVQGNRVVVEATGRPCQEE